MSSSHRQILRATSIVGGASALNIVIGLVRNKAAALLLGPAGIGVIGLLLNLVATAASVAGLGVSNAAVRQIASDEDQAAQAGVRCALRWLTIVLAIAGTAATWLLRAPLAHLVLGDAALGWQVGWLAPAVGLTLWSASQVAVLNGLRRLGDLARVQVLGALLGTLLGIAALFAWHERGVLAYVLAAPFAMVLIGVWFVTRTPRPTNLKMTSPDPGWRRELAPMLRLGVPMMLGGISLSVGALAIRSVIGNRIGAAALGEFTAAWTLSVTYVGFVLQAMGTDYLPRLTAVIGDPASARRNVNEQAEVALLLALPVMLGMQAAVPWVVWLLYSSAFAGATDVLRWLIVADVMKIAGWPLGFVIIAQARAKTFLAMEVATLTVTLGVVALLVDQFGIQAVGMGYCASYLFYLVAVSTLARRSIGVKFNKNVIALVVTGIIMTVAIGLLSVRSPVSGLVFGGAVAIAAAGYTLLRLNSLDSLPYPLQESLRHALTLIYHSTPNFPIK